MAILGKILAGPGTNNTVIYKVPTGRQATVSVNAVVVSNTESEFTLSLIKNKDNIINSVVIDNGGSGFTAIPTISINGTSTTTATAVVTTMKSTGVSIVSGGASYFPGNVLTITGGTSTTVCRLVVLTVDGTGAIQTATIQDQGVYSVLPDAIASHSGGQGAGATFSLTYAIESTNVTNPGNGYDTATVSVTGDGTGALLSVTYGVATESTDALEYFTPMSRGNPLERTGIPLQAGEMITASATVNNINVIVYGIEDLA